MKRSEIIQLMTVSVAEDGQTQTAVRLYVEHTPKVSWTVTQRAIRRGHEIRRKMQSGMTAQEAMMATPYVP